jgi:capsular exopolysaccharide synthesis family protein
VLVDSDLRRARCHQVLAGENITGLTEVLTGARELDLVICNTAVENLDFLGSGSVPPNPTELVGSGRMADTLAELAERYRFVVIDSSPVLPVSDALLLSHLVDGVVVVANCTATPRQQVRAACTRLQYARGKILGIVLNRIHPRSHDYQHYYHDSYYSDRPKTSL